MTLPETFFSPKQAREKANRSSKKKGGLKGKGEKKIQKKNSKLEKPKAVVISKF